MARQEMSKEIQTALAGGILSKLKVNDQYVQDYDKNRQIYLFDYEDEWRGLQIAEGSELSRKISELEFDHDVKVYAVTREMTSFGEIYSFLCLSKYIADYDQMLRVVRDGLYRAYAYSWNKTAEECSEFGFVFISSHDGKIGRVG